MWGPDHCRLFISHASSNKEVAHLLKQELEKIQASCFVPMMILSQPVSGRMRLRKR